MSAIVEFREEFDLPQGVHPARIDFVHGVDLQTEYALVENVTYDILVDFPAPQGTTRYIGRIPNHRRPARPGTNIMYARPDDECEARVRGNIITFCIVEGLWPEDC